MDTLSPTVDPQITAVYLRGPDAADVTDGITDIGPLSET